MQIAKSKKNTSGTTSREIDMTGVSLEPEIVPQVPRKSGNTKQISPAKHWLFTLNNYNTSDITSIKEISSSIVPILTFQEEIGEGGTPHLQGSLTFANKSRPFSLGLNSNIHWEKKSNKSTMEQFRGYCIKEDTRKPDGIRYMRGWEPEVEYVEKIDNFYEWENECINILSQGVDSRKIYWLWESSGNIGKTVFCKWVFTHYQDVVVLGGKAADMKNAIVNYKTTNKKLPKIVLIDIPRSIVDFVSYQGIEEIKNMFFYSGKYKGGMICGESPHMLIFANEEPNYDKLSSDRWVVKHLRNTAYSSY